MSRKRGWRPLSATHLKRIRKGSNPSVARKALKAASREYHQLTGVTQTNPGGGLGKLVTYGAIGVGGYIAYKHFTKPKTA